MKKTNYLSAIAGAALLVSLSACGEDAAVPTETGATAVVDGNLADAIGDLDGADMAEGLLEFAGFEEILTGPAPYTIFLPSDAALSALGEDRLASLQSEEGRPELIAMLRTHIAPGSFSAEDIDAAIESKGGPVNIANVGGSELTLSAGDDGTVTLGGGDGPKLTGQSVRAGNGTVYLIDALVPPPSE